MQWVDSTRMVQTWLTTLAVVLVFKGTTLPSAPYTVVMILSLTSKVPNILP